LEQSLTKFYDGLVIFIRIGLFLLISMAGICVAEVDEVPKLPTVIIRSMNLGEGARLKKGMLARCHLLVWRAEGDALVLLESSRARGYPISFRYGEGEVVEGLEEGMKDIKVGERRSVIAPANTCYGERGFGALVPPNTDLRFEVELVDVEL
jgi:peptidylprolyl isomerase